MSHAEVQATMKSVAELIATMQDPKAQHVCWVIAGMLERCLNENVELRARVAFLEAENAALRAENAELRAENAYLKEQVAYLKRQIFGKKSEFKPKDRPPLSRPRYSIPLYSQIFDPTSSDVRINACLNSYRQAQS